jgi:hypothetical protein
MKRGALETPENGSGLFLNQEVGTTNRTDP